MYIPNGGGTGVQALDATNGELLWDYRKEFEDPPPESSELIVPSRRKTRNLAIYGDKVFMATFDNHLVALDAKTGAVAWDKIIADYHLGYRISSGPIVVKGKIVSGLAGCDRYKNDTCFISAWDPETGKQLWRTSTVAQPGEPGGDTWGNLPAKFRAGGDTWIPGSYDPVTNLIYWSTSQPKPWSQTHRGTDGDALYTNCVLALNPETGKIVWYHQFIQGDNYDQDEVFENLLIDHLGRTSLFKMGKMAILWEVDRKTGKFVAGHDLGYQTLMNLDQETGKLTYRPEAMPKVGQKIDYCPSAGGFKNWTAMAYHPDTQAIYITLTLHCTSLTYAPGMVEMVEGGGGNGPTRFGPVRFHPKSPNDLGELIALDLDGNVLWRHRTRTPMTSAALTTAGGLVISGDWDRNLYVHDAKSGAILYQARLPNTVQGYPITYAVAGKQYLAIPMATLDAGGRNSLPLTLTPDKKRPPVSTNGLIVFALPRPVSAPSR
jgi:alcohol dehydrogenase (cytochrome c)